MNTNEIVAETALKLARELEQRGIVTFQVQNVVNISQPIIKSVIDTTWKSAHEEGWTEAYIRAVATFALSRESESEQGHPLVAYYIRFFVNEILHGDEVHRAWLSEAGEAFITGKPIPPPRAKAPIPVPTCEQCGVRPATCKGEYETDTGVDHYACDDCCGHGNEDGHCEPIHEPGIDEVVKWAMRELGDLRGEIEAIFRRVCLSVFRLKKDVITAEEWTVVDEGTQVRLHCGKGNSIAVNKELNPSFAVSLHWIARCHNEKSRESEPWPLLHEATKMLANYKSYSYEQRQDFYARVNLAESKK